MTYLYICIEKSGSDLPWALLELQRSVAMYEEHVFHPLHPVAEYYQDLEDFLEQNSFDCMISYLFDPGISDICQSRHMRYICWVYDSPLVTLFTEAAKNPCNSIFLFDHTEYLHMQELGLTNVYYLPMGVNLSRTGALSISDEDEKIFSSDISFIGSLYEDNSYNSFISSFPEEIAAELKLYLLQNLCKWDTPKPWPRVSSKVCNYMNSTFSASIWNREEMDFDLYLGSLLLSRKLAEMDRITVLNTLAEHYNVDLYTRSDCSYLRNVHTHSGVDYNTDMNKIFYFSKINLNITLPSIETGIPQRIFDIMGCGGFVLTNYQVEIADLFTIGKDIEVFHDLDELLEKTAYYLSHEEERLRIAINGYKTVRDHYSYTTQLSKILSIVEEETP